MRNIHSMILIHPRSAYNAMVYFLEEMKRQWIADGIKVEEFANDQGELSCNQVKKISDGQYDLIFSFNGMGLETPQFVDCLHKGKPIYCTMLQDHPLHHHVRLTADVDRMFVLAVDYYHVQFLNDYYPNIAAEAFLPHGGCAAKKIIPYREREILISFVGSYGEPEQKKAEFARVGGGATKRSGCY